MRLFAALVPPETVVSDLEEFLAPRQDSPEGAALRWTVPEQWHVTLAFMGDVGERHLDDLLERLQRAARRRPSLQLAVTGGGAFPDVGRARVLYAGLDCHGADAELRQLAVGTRAAAAKAGADAEGGRLRPHVTLARLGRPVDVTRWVRLLDGYRGPDWRATEVALVRSHLGEGPRRRPRYELVETFPLGAG